MIPDRECGGGSRGLSGRHAGCLNAECRVRQTVGGEDPSRGQEPFGVLRDERAQWNGRYNARFQRFIHKTVFRIVQVHRVKA